jgi:undecaprenyl-diphosphatase
VASLPPTPDAEPIEEAVALEMAESARPGDTRGARVLQELAQIDRAVYAAVAGTPSPTIDDSLRRLSNLANGSVLWLGVAAALGALGGRRGRRAAFGGLVSVAVSSAVVNLGLKDLHPRERPDREAAGVVTDRHAPMPGSSSFPSGHSASGFAFASAVGREIPWLAFPLRGLAAAVAYSRVHTGVHYPGDAVVGSLTGGAVGSIVGGVVEHRLRARDEARSTAARPG